MKIDLPIACPTCGGKNFIRTEDDLNEDLPVTCSDCGSVKSLGELSATYFDEGVKIVKDGISGILGKKR